MLQKFMLQGQSGFEALISLVRCWL